MNENRSALSLHNKRYPDETSEYRAARDELLRAEIELRDQVERVAELRRKLPMGAPIKEDYVFEEGPPDFRDTQTVNPIRLSELFEPGKNSLILINFMFAPADEVPCVMCNMWADGYDAIAPHVEQRANFVLVARTDIKKLRAWAASRSWQHIRLLSSLNNTFNQDYLAEIDNSQKPSITVFHKDDSGQIRHFYSIEAHWTPRPGDPRHIDLYSPVWNLLDLTPEGRGESWYPQFAY